MKQPTTLKLVSAGAGVAIFGGIGWIMSTGDWIGGFLLLIIGFANLAQMGRLWKEVGCP